jgi:large conductance mechanosensitive channel
VADAPTPERHSLLNEFKAFLLRGNVVDLAVAVVIGAAFGAVVTALVRDLITPIVSIPSKHTNFANLAVSVRGSRFAYGDFLNTVITFVIIAAVIFFLVIQPLNYIQERRKRRMAAGAPEESVTLSDEALLLTEIRDLLRSQRPGE